MLLKNMIKRTFSSNYYMDYHKQKAYNTVLDKTINIFRRQGFENKPGFIDLSFSEPVAKHYLAHTFIHQTVAAIVNPKLLNSTEIMPEAKEKARKYLNVPGFNVGAYSESRGTPFVRKNLAKAIEKRDGYAIDVDSIFLTNGAMNAYDHIINLIFNRGEKILVPNPCPSIFTNFHTVFDIHNVEYKYDLNNFRINFSSLSDAIKNNNSGLKAMFVMNANEPLGTVFTHDEMINIIKFCYDNSLVLIAYETLQDAIHNPNLNFNSFRKVVLSMPSPYNNLEIFSVHSTSKTAYFESSFRSSYFDTLNIDPEVALQMYKYKSIDLCSNIPGQLVMDLVMCPPSIEEFGEDFVNKYKNSIEIAKKENYDSLNRIRNILSKNRDLQVPSIDAGYSFFCKLNPNENLINLAQKAGKSISHYYSDRLHEEKNILINAGEGKIEIKIEFGARGNNENYVNIYANLNVVDESKYELVHL